MAVKLLSKQLMRAQEELAQQPGFSVQPIDDNILQLNVSIVGPEDTPYEGGKFDLRINFSVDYPLRPPKIYFLTKVYHPNVDSKGNICIDFLKVEWKPVFSISNILLAVCSLLKHPNTENPISPEIADMYLNDKPRFDRNAREMTIEHAKRKRSRDLTTD